MRGNNLTNHQFLVSDGIGPYLSSPADISPSQQWTPPAIQEISNDDYGTSRRGIGNIFLRCLVFYLHGICLAYNVVSVSLFISYIHINFLVC